MADISNYTEIILTQAEGEKVRDAFVDIMKILTRMGGDTSRLNGFPITYFATDTEMNDMYDKFKLRINWEEDGKPSDNSDPKSAHLLTSGQIYDAVNAVDDILEDLNNYEVPKDNILEDLKGIERAKKAILSAIKTKAPGKFTKKSGKDTKDFRMYAKYIHDLNGQGTITLKDLTIDKISQNNTTITADTEEADADDEDGHRYAYKKITTNIQFKTETKSVSYNDTLHKSGDSIGFSKVTVNESSTIGYGRSGGANGRNRVDENGIADSVTITENGPHSASDDAVNGWRTVVVKVENNDINWDTKYKVQFFNSDGEGNPTDLIDVVDNVPYNGTAVLPEGKEPTVPVGMYFAGWNPPSSKIRQDTDCVAVYTRTAPGESETSLSWEEIVAAAGTNVGVGQYKTLALLDNRYGSIRMQKVAVNESGSSSTWIAMDTLTPNKPFNGNWANDGDDPSYRNTNQEYKDVENPRWMDSIGNYGWSMCNLRQWLNNEFYNNCLPEFLRDAIVEVPKLSFEFNWDHGTKYMSSVYDRIWIPSLTELLGDVSNTDYRSVAMKHYEWLADDMNGYGHFIPSGAGDAMDYDRWTNEFKGTHYSQVYPSSNLVFRETPTDSLPKYRREPANANGLCKAHKVYELAGESSWFTRTVGGTSWQVNSNFWGPYSLCITNYDYVEGTGYTKAKIGTVSSAGSGYSLAQVAIGFCL